MEQLLDDLILERDDELATKKEQKDHENEQKTRLTERAKLLRDQALGNVTAPRITIGAILFTRNDSGGAERETSIERKTNGAERGTPTTRETPKLR